MYSKVCISRIVLHLKFSRLWRFILWPSELWHIVVWSVVTAFRMDTLLPWSLCNTLRFFDRFAPTNETTRCHDTEDRSVNLAEFLFSTLRFRLSGWKLCSNSCWQIRVSNGLYGNFIGCDVVCLFAGWLFKAFSTSYCRVLNDRKISD